MFITTEQEQGMTCVDWAGVVGQVKIVESKG